jgi:hypothetical protein
MAAQVRWVWAASFQCAVDRRSPDAEEFGEGVVPWVVSWGRCLAWLGLSFGCRVADPWPWPVRAFPVRHSTETADTDKLSYYYPHCWEFRTPFIRDKLVHSKPDNIQVTAE